MATRTTSLNAYMANDADFRAWGKNISDGLTAFGWVQTADTGQINWTTVAKPVGGAAVAGYEVWRMNDALQATKPVYLKIEYGTSNGPNTGGLFTTIGTQGTNGAGNLVGASVGARRSPSGAAATVGMVFNTYMSGDSGRLYIIANYNPASITLSHGLFIERPKDSNGASQGDCVVHTAWAGSAYSEQLIFFDGLAAGPSGTGPLSLRMAGSPAVPIIGSDLAVSPHFVAVGRWRYLHLLSHRKSDLTDLTTFQMTYLGAVHTFMPFNAVQSAAPGEISAADGLSLLWE